MGLILSKRSNFARPMENAVVPGWKRAVFILFSLVLLASLVGNLLLVRSGLDFYAEQLDIRLEPAGRPGSEWAKPIPSTSVVYVGDSRVAQWTDPPRPPGWEAVNRGIPNQTTAQLLLRLDRDVLSGRPGIVVIQCGVNDLKAIGVYPGRRAEITRGCVANLRAALDRVRATGSRLVLTTIWPCGRPDPAHWLVWSDAIHEERAAVNRELLSWQVPGVEVVDCDDLLAAAGICRPEFGNDHLHLTAAAYMAINARVDAAVARAAAGR